MICAAGSEGPGGECSCEGAPGIEQGEWGEPGCYGGNCYANQDYDECIEKENSYDLGDETWCWNEKRGTLCQTTHAQGTLIRI